MTDSIGRPDYQLVIKQAERLVKETGINKTVPIDIEKAAKKLGVTILRNRLEGDVSGYLFLQKHQQPIIGVNLKHTEVRQRFTIAHEIGHLILHAKRHEEISFVDKNFFVFNRDSTSSLGIDKDEVEANFFAAELLMPAEQLYRDVAAIGPGKSAAQVSKALSKAYNVSQEAMQFRLNVLGFV